MESEERMYQETTEGDQYLGEGGLREPRVLDCRLVDDEQEN